MPEIAVGVLEYCGGITYHFLCCLVLIMTSDGSEDQGESKAN